MRTKKKLFKKMRTLLAQSASELAIFGSILLFVIGLIVRTGLYQGHNMNIQLRTMRLALTESYKTAHGHYRYGDNRGQPAGARNTASVMVVEDRISIDSAQALGTRDRFPIMSASSGTFSHNLFWKLDYGNEDDLPVYDVIVNGQRFPFSTAHYMRAVITPDVLNRGRTRISYYYFPEDTLKETLNVPSCPGGGLMGSPFCWEANCLRHSDPEKTGCMVVFKRVYNVPPPAGDEWCDNEPSGVTCRGVVNVSERFDLDHDGQTDISPGLALPASPRADLEGQPATLRAAFNWQWAKVSLTILRKNLGSRLLLPKPIDGIGIEKNINRSIDIDGDFQTEYVMATSPGRSGWTYGEIKYLDQQEGDVDFTQEDVGLKSRVIMLAKTHAPVASSEALFGGTYMLVEEGKLYGADGQFIRDTSRQDHVDIITRFFQLTRNTGRFCTQGQNPQPVDWNVTVARGEHPVKGVNTLTNPVEACGTTRGGNQNSPITSSTCMLVHADKTCLDVDTHLLYIRSRIDDLRGKRWITRVFTQD